MDKQPDGIFHYVLGIFVRATSNATALLGFLVVIPFTLWFAWVGRPAIAYSIAQSLFCVSFAWSLISMLQLQRNLRKLGLGPEGRTQLFSGPRPDDQDELRAWQWGWQFMYAVIAVLLSMVAMPVTAWLTKK